MISAKRMAAIFCKKGGSGEFTKMAGELEGDQLSVIQGALDGEAPVIASVRSREEWFALTSSHFVQQRFGAKRRARLDQVEHVVSDVRGFAKAKTQGGTLEVRLQDKSTFTVELESGGPYFAVMNVFLSLARVNRKPGGNLVGQRLTTNERRRFS